MTFRSKVPATVLPDWIKDRFVRYVARETERGLYCVQSHDDEPACPTCRRDPELRTTQIYHMGQECEGYYAACPGGCLSTRPVHREASAWSEWRSKVNRLEAITFGQSKKLRRHQ
jgi:hypothetical protein